MCAYGWRHDTPTTIDKAQHKAYVRIDAKPWARISIDGAPMGVTPLAKPIETFVGIHSVKFEHDWYQPIEKQFEIATTTVDSAQTIAVDFEKQGALLPNKKKPAAEEP